MEGDMSHKPEKIFYFAGTHWDREWFKTFQTFRFRLVETMNEICDVLERDPDFRTFHLDGQTSIVEDFLAIEPGMRDRMMQLLKDNRLKAGPWYTMPDEFLPSGESLIYNLLFGKRIAEELGVETFKCGFLCDIFGHIAQMPQILNGFGIRSALVGRGTNDHTCPSHFLWQSPDNSSCYTFKVPEAVGYGTFWYDVLADYVTGADPSFKHLLERSCAYIKAELKRSELPYVVLMDNMDHEKIHPVVPVLCSELEKIYGCPVVIDELTALTEALIPHTSQLSVKKGELIETAKAVVIHNMLITNTLSSRYDLKKSNDQCQILLEKWANPITAASLIFGQEVQKSYIDTAYGYLLKNHAHDSICGCSIDEVNQDMTYRFRQTSDIARTSTEYGLSSLLGLTKKVSAPAPNIINETDGTMRIALFNPLPFPRHEVVSFDIPFDQDYAATYTDPSSLEKLNAFKLIDSCGNEVPYNLNRITTNAFYSEYKGYYPIPANMYNLSVEAKLPAFGYQEYKLVPQKKPVRYLAETASNEWSAENEFIALTIHENGTLTLKDKKTNVEYKNLLSFLDDGEAGDGWFHRKPQNDRTFISRGSRTVIEKKTDGPCACVFGVTTVMEVPESLCFTQNGINRNSPLKELRIHTEITFTKTSPWVDLKITVDNNIRDHRLRVRFPSGISGGTYEADQSFCFVRRDVGFDRNTGDWKEPALAEKGFSGILTKRNHERGLTVISAYGVHEAAALDDPDGSLVFTLLRSHGRTFLTSGQPDSQLNIPLVYEFRLLPAASDMPHAEIVRIRDCFQAGVKCAQEPKTAAFEPQSDKSFFHLDSEHLVLSNMKRPENGSPKTIIARFVNYSDREATGRFTCGRYIKDARLCRLDESAYEDVDARPVFTGNCLEITAAPYKIVTYAIEF
jgi:alpha-mannosidase